MEKKRKKPDPDEKSPVVKAGEPKKTILGETGGHNIPELQKPFPETELVIQSTIHNKTVGALGGDNALSDWDEQETLTQFEMTIDNYLNQTQGAANKVHECTSKEMFVAQNPEEAKRFWEMSIERSIKYLKDKLFYTMFVMIQENKDSMIVFNEFNKAFYKLFSPEVRRYAFWKILEGVLLAFENNRFMYANGFVNVINNFITEKKAFKPSVELGKFFKDTFGIKNPFKSEKDRTRILYYPFTDTPKTDIAFKSLRVDLSKLAQQKGGSSEKRASEGLYELMKNSNELSLISNSHLAICLRKAIEDPSVSEESLANILKFTKDKPVPLKVDTYLIELFTKAEEEGLMTDGIRSGLFTGSGISQLTVNDEVARFFINALKRGITTFHHVSRFISHDALVMLMMRIGDTEKITWKDYTEECEKIYRIIEDLKDSLNQSTSFVGKLTKLKKRAKLKKYIDIVWEEICVPQLIIYGEILFSDNLALPSKPVEF